MTDVDEGSEQKQRLNRAPSVLILETCGIVNVRFLPYIILTSHLFSFKHSAVEYCSLLSREPD